MKDYYKFEKIINICWKILIICIVLDLILIPIWIILKINGL